MKKNRLFLLACLVSAVLFSGCEKGRKDGTVDPSSNEIHIRVWESDGQCATFIKKAGEEFHKTHPHIFIDYIKMGVETTTSSIANDGPLGVGADIFAAPHDKLGELVTKKLVYPTVDAPAVKKSVLAACSKALTYNGTMYGYPVAAETYALFYNKKLISESEVPKNFNEVISWTKKFNQKHPDKKGFLMDFNNPYYSIIFLTGNNSHLFGEEGIDKSSPNMNTPTAVKGAALFGTLRDALKLNDMVVSSSSCEGLFVSGNGAMYITGPWSVSAIEKAKVDFGVTTIPSMPGEATPACSFSGTRGMFVSSYSKHPEEAAEFAKFLTTPEMQLLRYKLVNTMPVVNVKVNSSYMDGFIKQLEYAYPMPSIPEMGNYWGNMGGAMYNIWCGADPKTELDRVNNIIRG